MQFYVLNKLPLKCFNKYNLAGLSVIILAYAPGVFMESLWSDDYGPLIDVRGITNHVLRDARPTLATLLFASFSFFKDPSDAWLLKSLALLALLLIFLHISKSIKESRYYNFGIFSVAIAFCIPSFQMYVHWANTWSFLWAALAGLYAFDFWLSSKKSRKVLAVLLLALALTTYPPVALFYFSVIAVTNVLNEFRISKFFNDVIRGLVLLIISGLVSVFLAFAAMQIAGVSPSGRVKLITLSGIPDKLLWLFSRPFVVGLRPFTIDSPAPIFALITSFPILLIVFFGVRRQSRQLREVFFQRVSVIVTSLLLTLAPIMITSDNQIEFRLVSGYCWGVLAIASYFLMIELKSLMWFLKVSRTVEKTVFLSISTVLAFIAITTVNLHFSQLFGGPYQKKTAFLNSQISLCQNKGFVKNVVILPPKEPFPTFQRLGVFSMSTDLASPWVPKPNVELLLRERKIDVPVVYLEVRPTSAKVVKTDCAIDLEEFRKLLI